MKTHQQQYSVLPLHIVQLGQDWGLGRQASWAVHGCCMGVCAWLHGGQCWVEGMFVFCCCKECDRNLTNRPFTQPTPSNACSHALTPMQHPCMAQLACHLRHQSYPSCIICNIALHKLRHAQQHFVWFQLITQSKSKPTKKEVCAVSSIVLLLNIMGFMKDFSGFFYLLGKFSIFINQWVSMCCFQRSIY